MTQQPWGAPPPPKPPDERPWWKRRGVVIGGSILAAVVVLGVVAGGEDEPAPSVPADAGAAAPAEAPTTAAPTTQPPARLGRPVRDGKFEFTVTRLRCGVPRVGSQYVGKTAQGAYCLLSVRVRNVGDEQRTFEQSSQYLYDARGRRYETDEAGLYLEGSKSFLEEVNPGNGITGVLVFDLPKGVRPAKVELHDSAFSGGVEVVL